MNILLVNVSDLHCILIVFVVHVERGKIETLKHAYTHIHVYMTAHCPGLVQVNKMIKNARDRSTVLQNSIKKLLHYL